MVNSLSLDLIYRQHIIYNKSAVRAAGGELLFAQASRGDENCCPCPYLSLTPFSSSFEYGARILSMLAKSDLLCSPRAAAGISLKQGHVSHARI
jgi:hypothetical protein